MGLKILLSKLFHYDLKMGNYYTRPVEKFIYNRDINIDPSIVIGIVSYNENMLYGHQALKLNQENIIHRLISYNETPDSIRYVFENNKELYFIKKYNQININLYQDRVVTHSSIMSDKIRKKWEPFSPTYGRDFNKLGQLIKSS